MSPSVSEAVEKLFSRMSTFALKQTLTPQMNNNLLRQQSEISEASTVTSTSGEDADLEPDNILPTIISSEDVPEVPISVVAEQPTLRSVDCESSELPSEQQTPPLDKGEPEAPLEKVSIKSVDPPPAKRRSQRTTAGVKPAASIWEELEKLQMSKGDKLKPQAPATAAELRSAASLPPDKKKHTNAPTNKATSIPHSSSTTSKGDDMTKLPAKKEEEKGDEIPVKKRSRRATAGVKGGGSIWEELAKLQQSKGDKLKPQAPKTAAELRSAASLPPEKKKDTKAPTNKVTSPLDSSSTTSEEDDMPLTELAAMKKEKEKEDEIPLTIVMAITQYDKDTPSKAVGKKNNKKQKKGAHLVHQAVNNKGKWIKWTRAMVVSRDPIRTTTALLTTAARTMVESVLAECQDKECPKKRKADSSNDRPLKKMAPFKLPREYDITELLKKVGLVKYPALPPVAQECEATERLREIAIKQIEQQHQEQHDSMEPFVQLLPQLCKRAVELLKKGQRPVKIPRFFYYPGDNIARDQCSEGDFQCPSIEEGQLEYLRLQGKNNNFLKGGAAEIGVGVDLREKIRDMMFTEEFAVPLDRYVGKYKDPNNNPEEGDTSTRDRYEDFGRWSIGKHPYRKSDLTYVYPSNNEALKKCLGDLREYGLATLLEPIPEFLGLPKDTPLVISDLNFIAVAFKEKVPYCHHDFLEGPPFATVLVPLILPPSPEPEFVFKVGKQQLAPFDEILVKYRYRMDRALIFKGGIKHNTNAFGHVLGYRLMLCLHIGTYNKDSVEMLQGRSFRLPACRDVEGKDVNDCKRAAEKWKETYEMKVVPRDNQQPTLKFSWDAATSGGDVTSNSGNDAMDVERPVEDIAAANGHVLMMNGNGSEGQSVSPSSDCEMAQIQ